MNRLAIRTGKRDPFTPWHIPRSLLRGFIDFEVYASAAAVVDLVSGAAFTAAGSVALGTGANGRQCAIEDGVDDMFTFAGIPTGWPTGATAGWMFYVGNQAATPATTGSAMMLSYGGATGATRRSIVRQSVSGANRARFIVGDGSAGQTATESTVDFSGRHSVFAQTDGANGFIEIDGIRSALTAAIPSTGTTRARLGANTSTSGAEFYIGDESVALIGAGVLSDYYRLKLYGWVARTGR